ncbi:hypothetical protein Rhe02_18810 [Rhizocola hellebori]|uniref:Peptidoglycan binding-like domain-containing protein n=1 Tax=Rhizocola hellebori TaxID=1392758 RepID=A0A8J3Q5J9_9ACTN|nr:peptidoglycan-binding protein [Rhizocola hellebori]GIH03814.1 hypothetical protein Rhe02_18810 [Rhizocola hellebori]
MLKRVATVVAGTMLLLIAAGGTATATTTTPPTKGEQSLTGAPTAPPPRTFGPQSTANRIVQGLGDPHDDLNDESTLCNGCSFANGNYAGFWQAILWADGYLSASQVDCEFGPITARATANWQRDRQLDDDGVVGKDTRSVAQNFLYESGDPNYNLFYDGFPNRLYLYREAAAHYWIYWNNNWRMLRYTDKNIVGC